MSRVFIVTGKLGQGKTIMCVQKIQEYLMGARIVATNLDVNLTHIVGKYKKSTRLVRLPDHPTKRDLEGLGYAYKGTYDEEKTGAIVLDECGTWLNAREWDARGRKELISYLLHIRKMGWDVYLIVQDISMLDKQLRKSLAEHVVYCKRMDRMNFYPPLIGWFLKPFIRIVVFGICRFPKPKSHMGVVKLGDNANSVPAESWWLWNATPLYRCYDTRQFFKPDYPNASHSLLPPNYINSRCRASRNLRFYMRISKIYFRKFGRILAFLVGAIFVTAIQYYLFYYTDKSIFRSESDLVEAVDVNKTDSKEKLDKFDPLHLNFDSYNDLQITGFIRGDEVGRFGFDYFFIDSQGRSYDTEYFYARGIAVTYVDSCKAQVNYLDDVRNYYIYCGVRNYEINNDKDSKKVSLF